MVNLCFVTAGFLRLLAASIDPLASPGLHESASREVLGGSEHFYLDALRADHSLILRQARRKPDYVDREITPRRHHPPPSIPRSQPCGEDSTRIPGGARAGSGT